MVGQKPECSGLVSPYMVRILGKKCRLFFLFFFNGREKEKAVAKSILKVRRRVFVFFLTVVLVREN